MVPPTIPAPRSVLDYLSPILTNGSNKFLLREQEIPLQPYATFTGLQLTRGKELILPECTVSFTNQRLLMTRRIGTGNEVFGWGLDRQFIHAIKDYKRGLFKLSKRVRVELKDPASQQYHEECFFELKFPEEDFFELKQAFLNIQAIVNLCQSCEEDRLDDFQRLLANNPDLVNMVSN